MEPPLLPPRTVIRILEGEGFTLRNRRGTDLTIVHDGVPPGVSAADNEYGWQMALAKLAALVEAR